MKYLMLNSGVMMPMAGFGTFNIRGKEDEDIILKALDSGYRMIDTAQMYGNEQIVGSAVRRSGIDRKDIFVTTKIYTPQRSYKKAKEGIEQSLNKLQIDYIDMMLIHEPYEECFEMYDAMKEAHNEGKIISIGISNFSKALYEKFIDSSGVIPAVNQVESHVYYPQIELKEALESHGTKMMAWAPFTEGRKNIFAEPILNKIAEKYGKTSAQTALRFLVQNGIAVIPKSSNEERMKQNIDIFDFELTGEDMKEISRLNEGKSLFGWYNNKWL